jgi:hypothetical protein
LLFLPLPPSTQVKPVQIPHLLLASATHLLSGHGVTSSGGLPSPGR